jgi:hypothetical protein
VKPSTHRSDRRTYPGGVTEVILAVITIAGGYLTTRTWPTLLSRIKEHAALWKDVPDELREELHELLRDEVNLLAKRDRNRLHAEKRHEWLTTAMQWSGGISIALGVGATAYLLVANLMPQTGLDDRPMWLIAALAIASIALVVTVICWIRRNRLSRQEAVAEEKAASGGGVAATQAALNRPS